MSQPPDPYERNFSFTGWSINNPTTPHQGDKIDLELNEVKQSLDETQARLALIQLDDGNIRPSALNSGIDQITQEAADEAAERTYADNLASVADKALARANLQIPQHFPQADGATLRITSQTNYPPSFPPGTPQFNQSATNPSPGLLPTSTNFSRQFRAAVLLGTAYDWPTSNDANTVAPPTALRVDNVSMALLYGGTLGKPIDGSNPGWPANTFNGDYLNLNNFPSIQNPFATVGQIVDAVDSREAAHLSGYDHANIPSSNEKDAMAEANSPSDMNPFATMDDLAEGGVLTPDQLDAVSGSDTPSEVNVFITTSALADGLATKADGTHTHTWDDLTDSLGVPLQDIIEAKATPPTHVVDGGVDYLDFVASDGLTYRVAATPV